METILINTVELRAKGAALWIYLIFFLWSLATYPPLKPSNQKGGKEEYTTPKEVLVSWSLW